MDTYAVRFQNGKRAHTIKVNAPGIIPAIDAAIMANLRKHIDALSYEVISVRKIEK